MTIGLPGIDRLPSMDRLPAQERGITIGDFLVPIRLSERINVRVRHLALILAGTILIAVGAQISFVIPGNVVPITGQTFGVLVAGGALGFRRGIAATLLYLILGIVGLPFFALSKTGIDVVLGATGGYLIGFVVAAAIVGRLAELGWDRNLPGRRGDGVGTRDLRGRVPWLAYVTLHDLGRGSSTGLALPRRRRAEDAPRRGRVPGRVVGGGPPPGRSITGNRSGRVLRARERGLAAQPRGDAPARGRAAGAASPDRPSARRRGRRRALRLPGGSRGRGWRHAAVVPPDRLWHGDAGASRDPAPERSPSRHPGPVRDPTARERHGARYHARDPELSLWVHATLVDSTIAAYDAWIEPLSPDRRARFYDETLPVGAAFGIPAARLPSGRRGVRRVRRVDARAGRPGRGRRPRPRARGHGSSTRRSGRPRPPLGWPVRISRLGSTRSRPRPTAGCCGRRSGSCRRGSRGLRPAVGPPRAPRRDLARLDVAGLAAAPARDVPVRCPRRCAADRRDRAIGAGEGSGGDVRPAA